MWHYLKNFWDKISKPHGFALALFYVVFLIILTFTLFIVITKTGQNILCYVLYSLSAIGLAYFVYTLIYFAPKIKGKILKSLRKHKVTNSMLENYGYRTIVLSVISFIFNVTYVTFIAVLAFMTGSVWYITISAYYLVLIFMKGNVYYSKKKYHSEYKQARTFKFNGVMLVILTFALSGIIVLLNTSNMYFKYSGILIYAVALYTFYRLILAIYNIFKARKYDDLYIQNIRNINLASALVSIVVLQVAMFQEFSPQYNANLANTSTGGVVSAMILALGIIMIIKANKILKNLQKKVNKNEEFYEQSK